VLQLHHAPDRWRRILERIERASDEGLPIKAQVCGRPAGVMLGLKLARNPFMRTPGYRELAHLPHDELVAALRDPRRRARILSEMPGDLDAVERNIFNFSAIYDFDADGYEPTPERNLAARAAEAGVPAAAYVYDLITAGTGDRVLYFPAINFAGNSTAAMEAMMAHKDTLLGLGDGGAHCGLLCDASLTTFMLQRWSQTGAGYMPLEHVVRRLTSETAEAVGLRDRGILAPGSRADINIIDIDRIAVGRLEMVRDLPNGGGRIGQASRGYVATMVAGEVTYREGAPTAALPGRLVRGAQGVPA
jgi:N-acyl-D-aspartate/D-glutamate deacylase